MTILTRRYILAVLSLILLLTSGVPTVASPVDSWRTTIGFQVDLYGQDRPSQERERHLQLVQEVMDQVLSNYMLNIDPVRLAVGAIEGMSSASGEEQVRVERLEDAVKLLSGETILVLPLARDGKTHRENVAAAYRFIRKKEPSVSPEVLANGAIDGILAQLDPQSSFMSPEEYSEMLLQTRGSFGGVGIQLAVKDRQLTVVMPIAGTPADRAGLQPGDKIVKIDGLPTSQMTMAGAVQKLRGPPGSSVTLTLVRPESFGPFQVILTREIVAVKPIKSVELEQAIGYIKILSFSEQSGRDFQHAVQTMAGKGLRGLILDLRGNRGGLFNESVRVAELFLHQDQVIVSTQSRVKSQSAEHKTTRRGPLLGIPMIVLVNGGSASASEIVSGALQDQKRALIVGSKTYGKGSVQTIIPLSDGSALRLTTATYVTPRGQSIDGVGIHPDLVVRDQADEISQEKPADQKPAQSKKRDRSRVARERQRIIGEDDGDPSVVIGRRDSLDLHGDRPLAIAWRALQAAPGPDVDKLLSTARALLPAQRGAELDAPTAPPTPQ